MTIYEVKHVLGHADIKTTMRYAHLEGIDIAGRVRDVMNAITITSSPAGAGILRGRDDAE